MIGFHVIHLFGFYWTQLLIHLSIFFILRSTPPVNATTKVRFKGLMVREDNLLCAAQKSTLRHVSRSGELREGLMTLLVYDEESTNLQGSADVIDSTSIDASTHISFVCS